MTANRLSQAVARAVRRAPCTARSLAREAGVPASTLVRIAAGKRAATPVVARAVAQALDAWGARCAKLAHGIREAQPRRSV